MTVLDISRKRKEHVKLRWSKEEKDTIKIFDQQMKRNVTVTTEQMKTLISNSPVLKNRTVAKLRTYLSTRKKKLISGVSSDED